MSNKNSKNADKTGKFSVGEIFWGEATSFPYWPSVILEIKESSMIENETPTDYMRVMFFNEGMESWLTKDSLKDFIGKTPEEVKQNLVQSESPRAKKYLKNHKQHWENAINDAFRYLTLSVKEQKKFSFHRQTKEERAAIKKAAATEVSANVSESKKGTKTVSKSKELEDTENIPEDLKSNEVPSEEKEKFEIGPRRASKRIRSSSGQKKRLKTEELQTESPKVVRSRYYENAMEIAAVDEMPRMTEDMIKELIAQFEGKTKEELKQKIYLDPLTIFCEDIKDIFLPRRPVTTNVVDVYMHLLEERENVKTVEHTFYIQLGYKTLQEHPKEREAITEKRIFDSDFFLIPIFWGLEVENAENQLADQNLMGHFCMVLINFRKKIMTYYDSMFKDLDDNSEVFPTMSSFLEEQAKINDQPFDKDEWTQIIDKDGPRQKNLIDCGIYACVYAEYITAGRELPKKWTVKDISYFRQKMAYEILHKRILSVADQ